MTSSKFLGGLQRTMSYYFKDGMLLEKTLIAGDTNSNDREGHRGMAQLGDSLMKTAILSDGLERGLTRDELQKASSYFCSKKYCSMVARTLHLVEHIKISERQAHVGIQPTVLENAVAALVGAVWLDSHDYNRVLNVMMSIGLLNHAKHHDELQETLLMDMDPSEDLAMTCQRSETPDVRLDGDYWSLLPEPDRYPMNASEIHPLRELLSSAEPASDVLPERSESTPMYTPSSSANSSQWSAEHASRGPRTAISPASTSEATMSVERDEACPSRQVEQESILYSPQPTVSNNQGKVIKRSGRCGRLKRSGRPRADNISDIVEDYVIREELKEQSIRPHQRLCIRPTMDTYITTILCAPARSQHQLVSLATSIGDSSALLFLREAMRGLRSEQAGDALFVDRPMSTYERIDVIKHIGACSCLLRVLRFLHIVTLWEDLSQRIQDGSNTFVVSTPSSVARSNGKRGNPLFLASTEISQGFLVTRDSQSDIPRIDKASCGTDLRRLGQRLGLMSRTWGQGVLLLLDQRLSDQRIVGPNYRDFEALITEVDKLEGARISAVSAAASGILQDFRRGNRFAKSIRLEGTDDDTILGLPKLSSHSELLFQSADHLI